MEANQVTEGRVMTTAGLTTTVLFQDDEYRMIICEYQTFPRPDLFVEWIDPDGDWVEQVPLPIDADRAMAIAVALMKWAVLQPPGEKAPIAQTEVTNRFDSVEVSGLVEPVGGEL